MTQTYCHTFLFSLKLFPHLLPSPLQQAHKIRLEKKKAFWKYTSVEQERVQKSKEPWEKVTISDFESLAVVGRGAFGEVRLVRRKPSQKSDVQAGRIYALKSMNKEEMAIMDQARYLKAERDVLAAVDENNKWLTALHYSFTDESHFYMVMEYMTGGDLMSLLIEEYTFSEEVTKFFMAEAAHAISSVHAVSDAI